MRSCTCTSTIRPSCTFTSPDTPCTLRGSNGWLALQTTLNFRDEIPFPRSSRELNPQPSPAQPGPWSAAPSPQPPPGQRPHGGHCNGSRGGSKAQCLHHRPPLRQRHHQAGTEGIPCCCGVHHHTTRDRQCWLAVQLAGLARAAREESGAATSRGLKGSVTKACACIAGGEQSIGHTTVLYCR